MMMRPLRVLIADDDRDNREMYLEYLTMHGIVVLEAENGEVAVEKARRLKPDVIVMDLEMPVLDGFAAIQRLKADAQTRAIPLIVLSAGTIDYARIVRMGCRYCLVKPCAPQDLEGIVQSVIYAAPLDREREIS
jgi:two-component system cell cycle response regulator DivK